MNNAGATETRITVEALAYKALSVIEDGVEHMDDGCFIEQLYGLSITDEAVLVSALHEVEQGRGTPSHAAQEVYAALSDWVWAVGEAQRTN